MSNEIIISEFKRLVEFTKNKIDLLKKERKSRKLII